MFSSSFPRVAMSHRLRPDAIFGADHKFFCRLNLTPFRTFVSHTPCFLLRLFSHPIAHHSGLSSDSARQSCLFPHAQISSYSFNPQNQTFLLRSCQIKHNGICNFRPLIRVDRNSTLKSQLKSLFLIPMQSPTSSPNPPPNLSSSSSE